MPSRSGWYFLVLFDGKNQRRYVHYESQTAKVTESPK